MFVYYMLHSEDQFAHFTSKVRTTSKMCLRVETQGQGRVRVRSRRMDLGINVLTTTEVQICVLVSKQLNLAILQVLTVETGKTARQNQDTHPGRTRTNSQGEPGQTDTQNQDKQPGRNCPAQ